MNKKKISIDLDVVTVGSWKKKDPRKNIALRFLGDVKKKKFEAMTPVLLIKRIAEWEYNSIRDTIEDFYIKYIRILTIRDIKERIGKLNVNDEKVLEELEKNDIKSEDAFLVLITSIFDIDFLVTFNKKHLINKRGIINKVLRRNKLKEIEIIEPSEIYRFPYLTLSHSSVKLPFILSASFIGSLKTALFISSANFTGSSFAGIKTFSFMIKQFISRYLNLFPGITGKTVYRSLQPQMISIEKQIVDLLFKKNDQGAHKSKPASTTFFPKVGVDWRGTLHRFYLVDNILKLSV